MERFEGAGIESMLRELRPTPQPEFAAELDERAAAGFARGDSRVRRAIGRLRAVQPRRVLAPAAACAVFAIAAATAVVSTSETGSESVSRGKEIDRFFSRATRAHGDTSPFSRASGKVPRGEFSGPAVMPSSSAMPPATLAALNLRDIERSARITLLASPGDVADDSAQVFSAVHDAHGIVLRSNTTQGSAGRAGASFELLIPSARLGDALAAISAIDEVGSRHDATADITRSTVAVGERLTDSRARIDSLLSQIGAAETESEREALEAELRSERRQAAALKAQLAHLHRRTRYSHLSVRIETGRSSSSGAWGFRDALGDAGHILAVAAGVTLIALAVLAPIAILALLAWLAQRTWLRVRRERALS